jgi:hypothetical protein
MVLEQNAKDVLKKYKFCDKEIEAGYLLLNSRDVFKI